MGPVLASAPPASPLNSLSFFFLTFIFGYTGSLLLHKLSLVGLPFPSPRDVPDPGIKPVSPALAGGFFTTEPQGKPHLCIYIYIYIFFKLLWIPEKHLLLLC